MKKILFVDDESMVLDGLSRMLRSMRHDWEMTFVESGREALLEMAKGDYDVIVSDMRMPGMDGTKLLGRVMQRYPNVIRIALSGHLEMAMLLESVRATHQFLAKPCDAEVLKGAINRAFTLRDLLVDTHLSRTISRLETLPSLPALYTEVMEEVRSPTGTVERIGKIIAKDLGMTAKILQLVNSAFFGLQRHVTSLEHAAVLLGMDVLRGLVLASKVFSSYEEQNCPLDMEALWNHSLLTATLARRIAEAEEQDAKSRDHAFMAGMLHDIGRLILATQFPEDYAKVIALKRAEGLQYWQAEHEILGSTHMEVGAYLLGLWGLPNPIVEGVAYHHDPLRSVGTEFSHITAVYVGNVLAHGATPNDGESAELQGEYLERLGLAAREQSWRDIYQEIIGNVG